MKLRLFGSMFTAASIFLLTGCDGKLEEYPDAKSVFRATFGATPPKEVIPIASGIIDLTKLAPGR